MGDDFYKNIKGFGQFAGLSDPGNYGPVPADWHVVTTDIKNSTSAIEQGRYKEINLSGAAVIMSVLNVAESTMIPYAFGGDGATMLIPPSLLEKTLVALAAVQAKVQSAFALELRAGCVPVRALYDAGASLMVAKFFLSPSVSQGIFQGNALALAENWLKQENGNVLLASPSHQEPDLNGLECRWQPLQNRRGKILSLLVRVTPDYETQAWQIYADILRNIEAIYPDDNARPVSESAMRLNFSPTALYREVKLRRPSRLMPRLLYLIRILLINSIGRISFSRSKPVLGFDGKRYLRDLVANSDTRKFDEMLRMVLDSTQAQHEALELMLVKRHRLGQIAYGIHESAQALMTCLVFNLSGNHVHLVDGAEGGYALAARQMKQQMSALGNQTHAA